MNAESKKIRPEKQAIVREIKDKVARSEFIFITDSSGLNMEKTTELKTQLRELQSEFHVVRNRLFKKAVDEEQSLKMDAALKGATGVVTGEGDVSAVAKVLKKFHKENAMLAVKAGSFEGELLSAADVIALADMPPKPVLQAMLLGVLIAPMTQLAGVLNQKAASLLYVLNAIIEKKEEDS